MKKTSALLGCLMALAITANAQTTNLILKDDGSGNPIVTSSMYEDGGLVGIGTTSTSAILQINKNGTNAYDFLSITRSTLVGFPPSVVQNPVFNVTEDGFVGIGVATPEVLLQMKITGFGDPENPMSNPFFVVNDENDETIWAVANTGDATNPAALMVIRSRPNVTGSDYDNVVPAFAIMNTDEELLNFAVGGDGTVALGMDISGSGIFEEEAQLNIHQAVEPLSGLPRHNFLLNVTNAPGSTKFLSVRNTGEVGIGQSGNTNTALTIFKDGNNTLLDMRAPAGYTNSIRFMNSTNAPRHLITEASGDFVIDPGVSGGGGNDLLKIQGNASVYGNLTVHSSSGTEFKVYTDGKVRAREVQVDLQTIPDYVFDKDYQMYSIEELSSYITSNHHLPNIPSECDYNERGCINLTELNIKLLEKVEELTLYLIQLNDQIKEMKNEK